MIKQIGDRGDWNRIERDRSLVEKLNREAEEERRKPKAPKTPKIQDEIPSPDLNLNGFFYVPSINRNVFPERLLLGKTYDQAQGEIQTLKPNGVNVYIPQPVEFREFLKFLRDTPAYSRLYKEITEVREPWRANWINARFKEKKSGLYMISENVLVNGKYQNTEQKLDNYLAEDKTPGISLDAWLNSTNKHGLPPVNIQSGSLYYWNPVLGYVARFVADSDRADLNCNRHPDYSYSSLGVFVFAEGAQNI